MLASMLVGFVVGIFQATTQIQEQTLSYVPKLVAVFLSLLVLGPWMLMQAVRFARAIFEASRRSTEMEPWASLTRCSESSQELGYGGNVSDFLVVFGLASDVWRAPFPWRLFWAGRRSSRNIKIGLSVVVTALLMPAPGPRPGDPGRPVAGGRAAGEGSDDRGDDRVCGPADVLRRADGRSPDRRAARHGPARPACPTTRRQCVRHGRHCSFKWRMVIFLFLNGHLIYIRALADSFNRIPLFGVSRRWHRPWPVGDRLAQISGQVFVIALQLGGPVLLTLFLVDVVFGAISKIASQVNVHNESQPVKAFIGILILVPSMAFIFSRAGELLSQMIWNIYNVLAKDGLK